MIPLLIVTSVTKFSGTAEELFRLRLASIKLEKARGFVVNTFVNSKW